MGYGLHVVRAQKESDHDSQRISMKEWLTVIDADPSLVLKGEVTVTSPGGDVIHMPSPGLAVWHGHPEIPEVPFTFHNGTISITASDNAVLAKILQVAAALVAEVQGDEGELYEDDGSHDEGAR